MYNSGKDYYSTLGLEHDAEPEDIKHAYRRLAKKYHPDINPSPDANERFIEITEAYEILINKNLHHYYAQKKAAADPETFREEYEKARQAARESARRYARMKYEKFRQEQEAYMKSGWHDVILTFRYIIRFLLFPFIAFLIAMPLISEEVGGHPSGYVMFWLLAAILMVFIANNRKKYFRFDQYYYNLRDIRKMMRDAMKTTGDDCYYCKGNKAVAFSYKLTFFRIRNIQLKSYGGLYGRSAGVDRIMKTVRIPRSKKALLVHSLSSLIKTGAIAGCMIYLWQNPWFRFSLPAGILSGSLLSGLLAVMLSTKPKVSYLLSYGMILKFLVWLIMIFFMGQYAYLLLFFDPMIEAILRQASRDRLFIPITKQHPKIGSLLKKRYQLYLELPVWSVINPFFRWLF